MNCIVLLTFLFLISLPCNSVRTTLQATLTQDSDQTTETPTISQWTPLNFLNDAPEKRRGHSSIVVGDELLIFGGCLLDQKCFNDFHSFNIQSKLWLNIVTGGIPPSPREGHAVAVVGTKMYLFGGGSSSAFYNDLFIYDLESKIWMEVNFQGPKPSPRVNHGAIVDKRGKIIIFGGFTADGYSNEVYIIDPVEEKWEKPFISGTAPMARESFSMTRVRNTIWIFGGFTDGGVLSDLVILDLDSMAWNTVETFGTKPSGRQGHGAILQEKNLIIFGGCNYKINTCFSDMYYLNVDSLWWTQVSDDSTRTFTGRESFSENVVGAIIYAFGGCRLYEDCYNDMLAYNTSIPCPNDCSGNGVCRNDRCVCYQGFFENDCSLAMKCKDDCNGHGECHTNGKCGCYPGYTGESCSIIVSCPQNCTNEDHGICQSSGECKCNPGFSGDACEAGTAILLPCPNDCAGHGTCDTKTGICICEKYFTGDDCSGTIDQAQIDQAKAEVAAQQLKEAEDQKSTIDKIRDALNEEVAPVVPVTPPPTEAAPAEITQPPAEEAPAAATEEAQPAESEKVTKKEIDEELQMQEEAGVEIAPEPEVQKPSSELTPEMFANAYSSEKQTQAKKQEGTYLDEIHTCPHACSYNGICREGTCYCGSGYTGEDCSISNAQRVEEGEPVEKLLKYAGGCFGIGIIIGIFFIFALVRKAEESEYMNIEKKEDDED